MIPACLSIGLVSCLMIVSSPLPARAADVPKPTNPLPKGAVGRLACREPEHFSWIAFSDDGKLAATSHPNQIRLWEVATGKQLWKALRERGPALVFSRDGKILVAGSWTEGITTWDVATGKQLRRIAPPATGREMFISYHGLAFSPDGKILAAIRASAIQLWDWPSGKELRRLQVDPEDHALDAAVFSPDGRTVAASGLLWRIRLWDVASGRQLQSHPLEENLGGLRGLSFSPDGRLFNYAFPKRFPIGMKLGPPVRPHDPRHKPRPPRKDIIDVYELASGKVVLHIEEFCLHSYLLPSPDGRLLGMLTKEDFPKKAYELSFWDARTGKLVKRLKTRGRPLRFSPDGKLLATTTQREILFYDVSALRAPEPKAAPVAAAALSRMWDDLASADAAVARRAVWALVPVPGQAVPLLRDRLKPAAVDAKQLAAWIAKLGDEDFEVRRKASEAIEDQGRAAEPALRKALATTRSLQARRHIKEILEDLGPPIRSPRVLRAIRAQEVLEYAGTPEAKKVLQRMAAGAPDAAQTQDAKAALARLARRAARR